MGDLIIPCAVHLDNDDMKHITIYDFASRGYEIPSIESPIPSTPDSNVL